MTSRAKSLLVLLAIAAAIVVLMGVVGPSRTLDKLPWYTAEAGLKLLSELGPEGRLRYLRNEFLDLLFLLAYSVLAFIATGWLWDDRLSAPALRRAQCLALIPGAIDLAETSLVISALIGYPDRLSAKIGWLCLATPAKWLAAAILVFTSVCGAALKLRKRPADR
jgi:hypothetical protein